MKINKDYVLQEVNGVYIVAAVGKSAVKKVKGYIKINESAAALWKEIDKGASEEELVKFLTDNYEVDEVTARKDVSKFIKTLKDKGILE